MWSGGIVFVRVLIESKRDFPGVVAEVESE